MSDRGPYYAPGYYACRVSDQGTQESKTGKPMIVFRVRPLAAVSTYFDEAGEPAEERAPVAQSYDRTVRVVINPENESQMDFALQKLRFAGFDGESFRDLYLVGKEVRCKCEHGLYEERQVEQWDLALPPRDEVAPIGQDERLIRRMDTLFGRKLKSGAASGPGSHSAPPTSVAAAPLGDDDIPF